MHRYFQSLLLKYHSLFVLFLFQVFYCGPFYFKFTILNFELLPSQSLFLLSLHFLKYFLLLSHTHFLYFLYWQQAHLLLSLLLLFIALYSQFMFRSSWFKTIKRQQMILDHIQILFLTYPMHMNFSPITVVSLIQLIYFILTIQAFELCVYP